MHKAWTNQKPQILMQVTNLVTTIFLDITTSFKIDNTASSLGYLKYYIGYLTYQRHYIRASQYYNYPALPNWPRHYRKRKRQSPRSGWPGPAPLPPGRPSWAGWGTCRRSCILKKTKKKFVHLYKSQNSFPIRNTHF